MITKVWGEKVGWSVSDQVSLGKGGKSLILITKVWARRNEIVWQVKEILTNTAWSRYNNQLVTSHYWDCPCSGNKRSCVMVVFISQKKQGNCCKHAGILSLTLPSQHEVDMFAPSNAGQQAFVYWYCSRNN